MTHWSGSVEFDFVGDENAGTFVATPKVLPVLTQLIASGRIEEAVRLYEGADASTARALLEQAGTLSTVSQKNLAQMFALARDFKSAAAILEGARRWSDAARMFEQAGDFGAAARCYERDDDLARAAAALERAGRRDQAIALHRRAGPSDALAEALARSQLFFEAAQVYRELAHARAEVEMLRMVPITDPERVPAVKRLGDLLERHGHLAPAAQLLAETLQQVQAAQSDAELLVSLARRLETMGRHEEAARVRALSDKQLAAGAPASGAAPAAGPAGPAADSFARLTDLFASEASAAAPQGPSAAATPSLDAYGHLKAIPIFGELALQDMKDLYRICEEAQFPQSATIIEQGAQGQGLFVIVQGSVQVFKVERGRTTPLASLSAGSYVGELSLVDDAPTSARVVAAGPVRALFISRMRFGQYLYTHEAAALRIYALFTRTLAQRLRQANKRG
jgi:tetratricopeptide (TPR) repeat protein